MRKLNLGCGRDIRDGWINLDCASLPGVDIVHDLAKLPLPFADESFDLIDCVDMLEHVDYIPLLRKLHRILAANGKISISVPHFTSRDSFTDPTHRNLFGVFTLCFFAGVHDRNYYVDFSFSRVERLRLAFAKRPTYLWNYGVEWLVNRSRRALNFYECSPLRVFPATNIEVTLVK